jgi:hypothetical protein
MLHACEVKIYVNATITVKERIYIYIEKKTKKF